LIIAGVDEVGRGCLAGPVTAAAVILHRSISGLTDSKKLSAKKRMQLSAIIKQDASFSFGHVQNDEIDKINIHQATLKAMQEAIINLPITPDLVYVDGKFIPNVEMNCEAVIGGDMLIAEISAASIIAKVYRDEIMTELDKEFPVYGFANNKGYGTAQHLAALKKSGYTNFHRLSFKGVIV
jgi:ribonuclease HII